MVEDKSRAAGTEAPRPVPLPRPDDYLVLLTHCLEKRDPSFSEAWRDDLRIAGVNAVLLTENPCPERVRYAVCFDPAEGLLDQYPGLRAVHSMGAGITSDMLRDSVIPHRLPLLRITDPGMASRMATFCLWGVLNYQRRCDRYYAAQRDSKWDSSVENYVIRENDSVRVGVLGLGNLGTATAKMLLGTGHRVSAWTRSARREADRIPGVRYFAGPEELLPFASGLDVVICLLPITSETQGVLDASLFGAMRRGGAVINVGRGGHVVEADLLAALDDGQLDAAVLDVFPVEPLASESRFWQHPKVRVFPHISSWTQRPGAARLIASNFKALDAGEKLGANQYIARERGY